MKLEHMRVPFLPIEPFTQSIVLLWNYSVLANAFDSHLWATALQLHNVAFTKLVFTHVLILARIHREQFPAGCESKKLQLPIQLFGPRFTRVDVVLIFLSQNVCLHSIQSRRMPLLHGFDAGRWISFPFAS